MQARGRQIGDTGQNIGEPGLRVDIVEACGGEKRQHDSGAVCPALRTGKDPIASSESDTAQRSFRSVVGQADSAIIKEAGEVGPALEHVVDRLANRGGARECGAFGRTAACSFAVAS